MIKKLLSLFGFNKSANQTSEELRLREAYQQSGEDELLEVDTPEMDEVYEQGYNDALEGRESEDTSEEYMTGYEDAVDDIERSEETW